MREEVKQGSSLSVVIEEFDVIASKAETCIELLSRVRDRLCGPMASSEPPSTRDHHAQPSNLLDMTRYQCRRLEGIVKELDRLTNTIDNTL